MSLSQDSGNTVSKIYDIFVIKTLKTQDNSGFV